MEINLTSKEQVRINSGTNHNDPFVNVSRIEESSDHHYCKGLSVGIYRMHQVFVIEKEGNLRVFTFGKNQTVTKSDLGWWKDGKIIYTNSTLKELPK